MSFALTTRQVRERSKTVTRRMGWEFLKPGDLVRAVEKCQGLKKGERMVPLATLRAVDVRREPLYAITAEDVAREGFPEMTPAEFVAFFCDSHKVLVAHAIPWRHLAAEYRKCRPDDDVTRIEFEYLP